MNPDTVARNIKEMKSFSDNLFDKLDFSTVFYILILIVLVCLLLFVIWLLLIALGKTPFQKGK